MVNRFFWWLLSSWADELLAAEIAVAVFVEAFETRLEVILSS
jgi:hypothetical protein